LSPSDPDAPPPPPTIEEVLLAALLQANQELLETFRVYDELETLGRDEEAEREVREISKHQTKIDRTVSLKHVLRLEFF